MYGYLEEFAVIAREGSLSGAARQLGVSQPALSRHLAGLESELGAVLVDRDSNGVRLSGAGHAALSVALQVEALERRLVDHFADAGLRRCERSLAVVALDGLSVTERLIGEACKLLNANGYRLELCERAPRIPSLDVPHKLLENRLADVVTGFAGSFGDACPNAGIALLPLADVPGVVSLAPTHPLAVRTVLTVDDLRGCSFVRRVSGHSPLADVWGEFAVYCESRGFSPRATTRHGGGRGLETRVADDVEVCPIGSASARRLLAMGQVFVPVEGLVFSLVAAVRREDEVVRGLVARACSLAPSIVAPRPANHRSMFGFAPHRSGGRADRSVREDAGVREELLNEPQVDQDLVLPNGTVVDKAYVALRNRLNRLGDGLSNNPVASSYEMIMHLWSVDDARAELEMPLLEWFTAYDYAVCSGRPLDECERILENLSSRNLIYRVTRGGVRHYHLLAWTYGIWEFSVLDYMSWPTEQGIYGSDMGTTSHYPVMHVCPVGSEVIRGDARVPYRDWEGYIRRQSIACVAPCQCRRFAQLGGGRDPQAGHCPLETCLTFGEMAQYWIDNGDGQQVTIDEALSLARAAVYEHAMVPQMFFSQNPEVVCFCHGDSCLTLSAAKATAGRTSSFSASSAYRLMVDESVCTDCGRCIARCPMGAVDPDGYLPTGICVGCGQCALVCPVGARYLVPKEADAVAELPHDLLEGYQWRSAERMACGYIVDFAEPWLEGWGEDPC